MAVGLKSKVSALEIEAGEPITIPELSGHPTTPSAGKILLYSLSSDKKVYQKDSTGTVTELGGGGGGVSQGKITAIALLFRR